MSLGTPIPVRLSASADSALSAVANSSGLKKAELIRIAVDEFLTQTAKTGVITQTHFVSGIQVNGHGNTITQHHAVPSAPKKPRNPRTKK
jgi:hypothetical protein